MTPGPLECMTLWRYWPSKHTWSMMEGEHVYISIRQEWNTNLVSTYKSKGDSGLDARHMYIVYHIIIYILTMTTPG